MDHQKCSKVSDICMLQDAIACLAIVAQEIQNESKWENEMMTECYDKCQSIISFLEHQEANEVCKAIMEGLISTINWHKQIINIICRKMELRRHSESHHFKKHSEEVGNHKAITKTPVLSNSETNCVGETDETKSRRQVVLATIVDTANKVKMNDVAGLNDAKQTLHEAIIVPLMFPHLFRGSRKSWTRVLLYGPPGTGKSRLAQAIASEIDSTFFNVSSADLVSSWTGESEKIIRELFCLARKQDRRSVIFIDEIDSVARKRTSKEEEHTRRIKTELLKQMDGTDEASTGGESVFLICATNCPWDLDTAFLRRFQRLIYIPLPDRISRMEILQIHAQPNSELKFSDVEWSALLNRTEGFSGSDLANLSMTATFQPIRDLRKTCRWTRLSDGTYRPRAKDDQATLSFECQIQDLPLSKVVPREVTLDDFLQALGSTHRTVNVQEVALYEEFTQLHGQRG